MAVETLSAFPDYFVAGDTLRVTLSYGDYPSSDWDLTVYFRGDVLKNFSAEEGDNDAFDLVITASQTAQLTPGSYQVTFAYESDDERKTEVFGTVEVLPNPTAATVKSIARQTLEAMETAFLAIASGSNQTVSFNGQSFTKRNLKEFQDAIDRQRGIVAAEDSRANLAAGTRRSGNIYTRFSRNYGSCD